MIFFLNNNTIKFQILYKHKYLSIIIDNIEEKLIQAILCH